MTWSVISCGWSSVPVVSVEVILLILDYSWFLTLHWAVLSTVMGLINIACCNHAT